MNRNSAIAARGEAEGLRMAAATDIARLKELAQRESRLQRENDSLKASEQQAFVAKEAARARCAPPPQRAGES